MPFGRLDRRTCGWSSAPSAAPGSPGCFSWSCGGYAVPAGREDFEAFVAARYDALLRTAYLLTGDHHDAEDLLQQSLIKAVGAWGRIVGDPEPYVRTILVRQNVSRWRRRRWREVPTDLPPDRGVEYTGAEDRVRLQQALALLAPRQRAVIVLRYYDDSPRRGPPRRSASPSAP
jgi:RNA polymerase sigma-70 factor (sigma-E family)